MILFDVFLLQAGVCLLRGLVCRHAAAGSVRTSLLMTAGMLLPAIWAYLLRAGAYYAKVLRAELATEFREGTAIVLGSAGLGGAVWLLGGAWRGPQTLLWAAWLIWGLLYHFRAAAVPRRVLLRYLWRRHLRDRVLVVTGTEEIEAVCETLARHTALLEPVAVCCTGERRGEEVTLPGALAGLRQVGNQDRIFEVAVDANASCLLRAGVSPELDADSLSAQCWQLGIKYWTMTPAEPEPAEAGSEDADEHTADAGVEERRPCDLLLKEAVDVAGSALMLALAAPLFLLLAIIVRLTSRGPALFRQERDGLHGRRFTIYKFRTMRADAVDPRDESSPGKSVDILFKPRKDPRVTAFGCFLRRSSLDELPQLWNVMKGDMSLVGPRPMLPIETAALPMPASRRRLSMKPGITGLWQVSGRSNIRSMPERLSLDLDYVDHWAPVRDVAILLRTVFAVISARGAQ